MYLFSALQRFRWLGLSRARKATSGLPEGSGGGRVAIVFASLDVQRNRSIENAGEPPHSTVLGHIGARGSAWWNVTLLDALFDFAEIRVTSKRPASRLDFAARLTAQLGKPVRAVATPEEALLGADIMVEASRLTQPTVLLRTAWVAPGTLVIPYGTVSAVELSLTQVMDKIVVDDWGQAQVGPFGALRRHVDEGLLTRETLHAELGAIVAGHAAGREGPEERILFWHRGLATSDIALAQLILRRAEQAGVGTLLAL